MTVINLGNGADVTGAFQGETQKLPRGFPIGGGLLAGVKKILGMEGARQLPPNIQTQLQNLIGMERMIAGGGGTYQCGHGRYSRPWVPDSEGDGNGANFSGDILTAGGVDLLAAIFGATGMDLATTANRTFLKASNFESEVRDRHLRAIKFTLGMLAAPAGAAPAGFSEAIGRTIKEYSLNALYFSVYRTNDSTDVIIKPTKLSDLQKADDGSMMYELSWEEMQAAWFKAESAHVRVGFAGLDGVDGSLATRDSLPPDDLRVAADLTVSGSFTPHDTVLMLKQAVKSMAA